MWFLGWVDHFYLLNTSFNEMSEKRIEVTPTTECDFAHSKIFELRVLNNFHICNIHTHVQTIWFYWFLNLLLFPSQANLIESEGNFWSSSAIFPPEPPVAARRGFPAPGPGTARHQRTGQMSRLHYRALRDNCQQIGFTKTQLLH